MKQIDAIEQAVKSGAISEPDGLAQAKGVARNVSELRDALRTDAQKRLSLWW